MRDIARLKAGYYPLAQQEAERIKKFLSFSGQDTAVIDPCAGTGAALHFITPEERALRHGIELDAYRAEESKNNLHHVIQGNAFDVQCAVESFSLLYCNPPYDHEIGENRNARMEYLFLEHTYRWLKPGGVLVLIIPGDRLTTCAEILAVHFRDKALYRLSEPESVRYKQIVVFGVRRTRREREQLKDWDASRAKAKLMGLSRDYQELPALPERADKEFVVPPSSPAQLIYRGIPLDKVEDLLAGSAAYRQANRILFAPEIRAAGRPLTPLHGGHVGLLTTSGLLNGIFGYGSDLHVARWESVKVTDQIEEIDENQVTTIRERERFTQCLTLVYADGTTAVLDERSKRS